MVSKTIFDHNNRERVFLKKIRFLHLTEIYHQLITGMKDTGWLEYIAVFSGITSVWFSIREKILVYPSGLLSTVIYIYISLKGGLAGEASVNFYYTVMSIAGWVMWAKKDSRQHFILHITRSTRTELLQYLLFFAVFYILLFVTISWMNARGYISGAIPWADAFASATAYTGMWLMNKKKIASWYWWIATNCASIPLYFVKGYVFTSVYYVVLLVMAFAGLIGWLKKYNAQLIVINTSPKIS